jgi:hypothetical protein
MTNKDLLKQYVDTGIRLREYQVKSLPPNLFKTYIRKRLIAAEQTDGRILEYEFDLMTDEVKPEYLKKLLERVLSGKYDTIFMILMGGGNPGKLEKWEYDSIGDYFGKTQQKKYLSYRLENLSIIDMWEFNEFNDNQKLKYIENVERDFGNNTEIPYIKHMGAEEYKRLTGRDKISIEPPKNNNDWDVPRPPEEINQVYESVKRHREILGYNK